MSDLGQGPRRLLLCQICFHSYGGRRRAKLLGCGHTCCSACLRRMCGGQRRLTCPWCRAVTRLPPSGDGLSVDQLPDDPRALPLPRSPVFMRLPGNACYLLPAVPDADAPLLPGELAPRLVQASQLKDVRVVTLADNTRLELGMEGGGGAGGGGVDQREEQDVKESRWTKACTSILAVIIFLFVLGVILQNITCVPKPFTMISCG